MGQGIKINRFGGMAPRLASELLPDGYAQIAENMKLTSGDLTPYRSPEPLFTLPLADALTIYPIVISGDFYWMMWTTDVDVVHAPNTTLTTQRFYYTGDGVPKVTDLNRATFYSTLVKIVNYTQLVGDYEKTIEFTAAGCTYALLAAATAGNQFVVNVKNSSAGSLTIDPNGAETIDGAATLVLAAGTNKVIRCSGTAWVSVAATHYPYDAFTLGLPVPTVPCVAAYDTLAKAAGYTAVAADSGKTLDATVTPWTLALTAAATLGNTWILVVRNLGTGTLTVDPNGAELINGAATLSILSGEVGVLTCNGTAFSGTVLLGSFKSYIYTWVTAWGEESPPSASSNLLLLTSGQRVMLSSLPSASPTGAYHITSYNIYRTNTGDTGTAFQFVANQTISATTTYTDNVVDAALGDALASAAFDAPPTDLLGILNMANGITAAFHGNEVCFSEPYTPHAWPPAYRYSIDFPIVAIGALGNSLIITTQGKPYIATGNHPSSMSVYPIDLPYPCLSKRALVNMGTGIMFPTYEGLVFISGVSPQLASAQVFLRDEWQPYEPTTLLAKLFDGKYTGHYTDSSGNSKTFIFQTVTGQVPLFVRTENYASAGFSDPQTGIYYYVQDDVMYRWDAPDSDALVMDWKSKDYVIPKPTNMGSCKIYADFLPDNSAEIAAAIAYNAALTDEGGYIGGYEIAGLEVAGDLLIDVPSPNISIVTFRLFTNKTLRFEREVYNAKPFRLPTGYKTDTLAVEVETDLRVRAILLAETPAELEKLDAS